MTTLPARHLPMFHLLLQQTCGDKRALENARLRVPWLFFSPTRKTNATVRFTAGGLKRCRLNIRQVRIGVALGEGTHIGYRRAAAIRRRYTIGAGRNFREYNSRRLQTERRGEWKKKPHEGGWGGRALRGIPIVRRLLGG